MDGDEGAGNPESLSSDLEDEKEGAPEEEGSEGGFHSLRHMKPYAREARRALDAAEAAAEQARRIGPKLTSAMRP